MFSNQTILAFVFLHPKKQVNITNRSRHISQYPTPALPRNPAPTLFTDPAPAHSLTMISKDPDHRPPSPPSPLSYERERERKETPPPPTPAPAPEFVYSLTPDKRGASRYPEPASVGAFGGLLSLSCPDRRYERETLNTPLTTLWTCAQIRIEAPGLETRSPGPGAGTEW